MSIPDTTTGLTFITHSGISVACSDCRTADDLYGGEHFSTLTEARDALDLYGWSRAHDAEPTPATDTDDTPIQDQHWRCPSCSVKRVCAISGHLPRTLDVYFDPGTGAEHHGLQVCERCARDLTSPKRIDPPADYPAASPTGRTLSWDQNDLPEGDELADALLMLIQQANAIGWLTRWDAYLTAHPDASTPFGGYRLNIPAALAAADRITALTRRLRERLADATVPATCTHLATMTDQP
ncbi:hypothetical protein ACLQ2R_20515 [Streptosporangium sp. DT93]|uniref:hypothetical protein n=1 Tax=Streptosporangium sp. DT93 TaxID=3393428 RepID=UPI003CF86432